MKIYRARHVLPVTTPPLTDGAVAVERGRIVAVGPVDAMPAGDQVDLGAVVLLPGLINAHCHLDYTVMRGAILAPENFPRWIRRINDLKRSLADEDYLESIAAGYRELRRWGTTSVLNVESFPELMVRLPAPPLRTWWFYELLDIRNRIHTEDVVAGALTFFEQRRDWLGGFGLSPHAPYTTSAGLYELTKFCAEKYTMPWTTHLAETEEEFAMFTASEGPLYDFLKDLGRNMDDTGGVTPVEHLFRGPGVPHGAILAHMNCLADSDYDLLARRTDVTVVHCPKCHAYFRRPEFPLHRLQAIGVPVALGTDSLASNSSLDLFAEMRQLRETHPDVPARTLVEMVTTIPARAIGQAGLLGELRSGAQADLIAVPAPDPDGDPWETVVENRSPIEWMRVAGRAIADG